MIRLFERTETNFNHNQNILSPLSCFVTEEENGMYELEMEVHKSIDIDNGQIIKAPTPRGEQCFRVYRTIPNLKTGKIYARHIYYDLVENFIESSSIIESNCQNALQNLLSNTAYPSGFTGLSDISKSKDLSLARVNPVTGIMGDNGILATWGGNLVRDGKTITIKGSSLDRGYEIRLGKNLTGIECDNDESNVITRLYPTTDRGDGVIISLPEKYVDSPLLANYGNPKIQETKITLTEEQKVMTDIEIYVIMRDYCNLLYNAYNIDKLRVNYKVNFVELSKTEQYKNLAILEQLDLYDMVTVNVSELDINVKAKVIKYKYDCLKQRYEGIELGNFKRASIYQTSNIVKSMQSQISSTDDKIEKINSLISGNVGGYVVMNRYPDGKAFEILVMDTEDINTAVEVTRINKEGIGISHDGYNGPFVIAMTLDGHFSADFVDTGSITSQNYVPNVSGMKQTLTDGTIDSKNFKVDASGNITASNAKLTNATVTGGSLTVQATSSTQKVVHLQYGNTGNPYKYVDITPSKLYSINTLIDNDGSYYQYEDSTNFAGGLLIQHAYYTPTNPRTNFVRVLTDSATCKLILGHDTNNPIDILAPTPVDYSNGTIILDGVNGAGTFYGTISTNKTITSTIGRPSDSGRGLIDFGNVNGNGYQYATKYYTFKSPTEAYMMTQDYDGSGGQLSIVANGGVGGTGHIRFYTGLGAYSKTASMILDTGNNLTIANSMYSNTAHVTKEVTAGRFAAGWDGGYAGSMMATNWFRSAGSTGWYNETYGGGWYMYEGAWVRCYGDKGVYTYNTMQAINFVAMSTVKIKENIIELADDSTIDTVQLLKDTKIYSYYMTKDLEEGNYFNKKIGMIVEATPEILTSEESIDLYTVISTLWDVVQKQQTEIEQIKNHLSELETLVA
jgi:phage minor structural protein, N-terminal region